MPGKKRWFPLESNPEVMNKYVQNLGMDLSKFRYHDVFGFDEELLKMVPAPCIGALLLYPLTEENEKFNKEKCAKLQADGQKVSDNVYFMKQTVGNACGTIGILHSIGNNLESIQLEGFLKKFFDTTKSKSPDDRASALEEDDEIETVHDKSAHEGQTQVEDLATQINLHFIAFCLKDGDLYELDGRKPFPINHGPSSVETLLVDVGKVTKELMALNPDNVNFNLIGLATSE
eukprot:TRINITY_DN80430_c0_g1_i1.p1 TRINITY_DN80430_c0_g1~~TRINITY_DN80430_c0_g1_i1.p1  ORF type:complete len:232 (-),score=42.38 TRINITY_DN80430_c0_g1_i1:42-737(-)